MIARQWTGRVPREKATAYLNLMRDVALRDYRATAGNKGAWCLHQTDGNVVSVTMLTFWEDMAAVMRFAGTDPEIAKYYDFDADYLLEMTPTVDHYGMIDG